MSIGLLKRLLTIVNLVAIVMILGSAYGFWSHKSEMKTAFKAPDFRPDVKPVGAVNVRIDDIRMQLGRFPKVAERAPEVVDTGPKVEIEDVLKRLGWIKSAFVVYPPYPPYPAIIFEFKEKPAGAEEKLKTIRMGEALMDRPHRDSPLHKVPVAYKFVGCEPDPENPGWTYFLFDMKCDGTDIQKARWKLETDNPEELKTAEGGPDEGTTVKTSKIYVGSGVGEEKPEPKPEPSQPGTVEPVQPPPEPARSATLTGNLFDDEQGTFAPTSDGVEYLKTNYQELLNDAQTSTWRDPNSGRPSGIKVNRLRPGSAANAFGIRADDVILAINDKPVASKAQATNVVKAELRRKPAIHIIRVKILRFGKTKELRFDTRDPATRRAARSAFK